MVDTRERIPAVVVLMLMLIGSIVVYLLLVPPATTYKLLGINNTSTNAFSVPPGTFFKNISSYIGGYPQPQIKTYPIGTFGVYYSQSNSTIFTQASETIGSSIFGSSSYDLVFNNTASDTYYLYMDIGSVSGSPKLALSLNGSQFYTAFPVNNESIIVKLPQISGKKAILSITDYLNGFAFTQSFTLDSMKIIEQVDNTANVSNSVKVMTFSGIGDYFLNYTEIGSGNLTTYVNGISVATAIGINNNQVSLTLPPSVVSNAIQESGLSSSSTVLPLGFGVDFVPGKGSSYEIANAELSYKIPSIAPNSLTLYYNVNSNANNYALVVDVANIINSGDLTLTFYPSGQSTTITSDKLAVGQNAVILTPSFLSGDLKNGEYTGTVTLSSNGLIVPEYISIKPVTP